VNRDPTNGDSLRPHPNADTISQPSDDGPGTTAPGGSSGSSIASRIERALREVIDPELGINIVDLGLVYGVEITDDNVEITMSLTSAACPLGESIIEDIDHRLAPVRGARTISFVIEWEPPWSPAMMSAEARRLLGPDG
jgi:metal-sulfur cluster biosynthetic enzyme